jgi:NAD(P)H dehydrogenase (quinone)
VPKAPSPTNNGPLDAADAIIFGSPTYMGTVSWQFKKFADASSKAWFSQVEGQGRCRLHQLGHHERRQASTLHYLFTLGMQHSMIWSAPA